MPDNHHQSGVRIHVAADGHGRLLAARPFAAGETILHIEGIIEPHPSRHSVQIGPDLHVRPVENGEQGRSLWRYMNHSCSPTAAIRGTAVVALRFLEPGEEITFDYCTTEVALSAPFACRCASSNCRGWIAGFAHLAPAQQAVIAHHAAPHLRPYHGKRPQAGVGTAPEGPP